MKFRGKFCDQLCEVVYTKNTSMLCSWNEGIRAQAGLPAVGQNI